jgi:hypothetical protein
MLRLFLLALLPQIGAILLMVGQTLLLRLNPYRGVGDPRHRRVGVPTSGSNAVEWNALGTDSRPSLQLTEGCGGWSEKAFALAVVRLRLLRCAAVEGVRDGTEA